jgi:hypothetical protein
MAFPPETCRYGDATDCALQCGICSIPDFLQSGHPDVVAVSGATGGAGGGVAGPDGMSQVTPLRGDASVGAA